jgi:ubiquinone/menaquinone biosynthesis C-methylase UbiE
LSFYRRHLLPRLIHLAMRQKRLVPLRERMVGLARGRVLEVGLGSGLNLPFYGREIEDLVGIDPSRELLSMARKHTSWVHFPVKLMECGAESLPFEDGSMDSVVMTWTLCSIADPGRALAEMRRVLRPGGILIFVEHGQAPEEAVRRWQGRITPIWRKVAGGCHLHRRVDRLIEASGLRLVELEAGYMVKGPKAFTYHYRGQAVA